MDINYKKLKLTKYNFPRSLILKIDSFLDKEFSNNIKNEILLLDRINNYKKFYIKNKSNKIEYLDFSLYQKNSLQLIKVLSQKKFINFLRKIMM